MVAIAVAAMTEINEAGSTKKPLIEMNTATINKLLSSLDECTEWGQIFILDNLFSFNSKNDREAHSICKRITPRLSHLTNITEKLSSPFVILLSSEPEVQYVALRNISLIIQKRPDILKHEMKVYNDPIYYKLEKLDIMIRVASQANIAQVLSELKDYAIEVDVDFVRKSVRAIGRCAIKVKSA